MKAPIAVALLAFAACVSQDKQHEREARAALVRQIGDVATLSELCQLKSRGPSAEVAQCRNTLEQEQASLEKRESEYRAACLKCASAAKCAGELRRIHQAEGGAATQYETACP